MTSRLRVRPPFDMSHLDKALEGKHSPAHFWLEYAQGDGGERNELFAALLGWAQERASLAALDIAGNIYSNEATRSEFQAFQQITAQFPQAENVEKRVRFDVFHRSLTWMLFSGDNPATTDTVSTICRHSVRQPALAMSPSPKAWRKNTIKLIASCA